MTPFEIAQLILASAGQPTRDPKSGLYIVCGTPLTLAQFESGMRVLRLREELATSGQG